MGISKKSQKFILKFIIFYFLLMGVIMANFFSNGNDALITGDGKPTNNLDLTDIFIYHLYKYALNFPLGIFNWFTDSFMYTTPIIAFVNGSLFTYIIIRFFPERRSAISVVIYFFCIIFLMFLFMKAVQLLLNIFGDYLN